MYGVPAVGGITPERGWKNNARTGQRLEATNLGAMGDRAFADGPEGAASRPHAYTRVHNRVSEEVKPGYAGHTPLARDTFGTSYHRDAFTHRHGASRHHEPEDGAYTERSSSYPQALRKHDTDSARSTRSGRVYLSSRGGAATPTGGGVNTPARSMAHTRSAPGLTDRERITGRPTSARKVHTGGRYFTLNNTPRGYTSARARPQPDEVTI